MMTNRRKRSIVFTDVPWGDVALERSILQAADISAYLRSDLSGDDWEARVAEADGIATCWDIVDRNMMEKSPTLKIVARLGVGVDNIQLDAAEALGVTVVNVPDYCVDEVAEYVLAAAASWARGLLRFDCESSATTRAATGQRRLRGLTVGIWGLGRIGTRVATLFSAIGCRVLAHSRHPVELPGVEVVAVEEMLRQSDIVSVHIPGGAANNRLLDDRSMSVIKPGALLINTARASVVDTDALARGLESGTPAAAVLDVVDGDAETLRRLAQMNCLITPHIAFSSPVAERDLRQRACDEMIRVLRGEAPLSKVVPID